MGEIMDKDCSILILSCDANIDVLKIFLDKYKEYIDDLFLKTYVCLEKKKVNFEGTDVLLSKEILWSKRIKEYLKHVETNYVIVILDDFLIEKKVNTKEVYKYIDLIKKDNKIARITLTNLNDKKSVHSKYKNLNKQSDFSNYLINMQISIWNKDIFYNLLKDNENPWQAELYGSIRARKMKDYDFLYLNDDVLMPIKYNKGWLIVRGKWNKCEIDRLHLLDNYSQEYFSDREVEEINYKIEESSFFYRVKRRFSIITRQILSYFRIYI